MRPELRTFRVNGHYLIGAGVRTHLVVLHPDTRSVTCDVDLQAGCTGRFFLSQNGGRLAVAFAYEELCCVEVIDLCGHAVIQPDLREKATVLRLERVYALDVGLAPDGETLLYVHATKPEGYVAHLPTGHRQKLPNTHAPMNGAWLTDAVILPMRRGKGAVRVSYRSLTITPVELPSKVGVWRLSEHPNTETVSMLTHGQVASLRADTLEPVWRHRIPAAGWISYSGDGRFIAVQDSAENGGFKSILILDSASGETVRRVDEPDRAACPLDGPRFLCHSGRFLNAETGEFEEGVSGRGFWDTIVKQES